MFHIEVHVTPSDDGNMDHKITEKKQSKILTQCFFFTPQRPFIVSSPRNMRFNCVRMTSFCKIYNMKKSDPHVRNDFH